MYYCTSTSLAVGEEVYAVVHTAVDKLLLAEDGCVLEGLLSWWAHLCAAVRAFLGASGTHSTERVEHVVVSFLFGETNSGQTSVLSYVHSATVGS